MSAHETATAVNFMGQMRRVLGLTERPSDLSARYRDLWLAVRESGTAGLGSAFQIDDRLVAYHFRMLDYLGRRADGLRAYLAELHTRLEAQQSQLNLAAELKRQGEAQGKLRQAEAQLQRARSLTPTVLREFLARELLGADASYRTQAARTCAELGRVRALRKLVARTDPTAAAKLGPEPNPMLDDGACEESALAAELARLENIGARL